MNPFPKRQGASQERSCRSAQSLRACSSTSEQGEERLEKAVLNVLEVRAVPNSVPLPPPMKGAEPICLRRAQALGQGLGQDVGSG